MGSAVVLYFEGLVEMCLITKMMGLVCEVVAVFL